MQFFLQTLAVSAVVATSYAFPLIQSRAINISYTNSNGLKLDHFNGSLPNITLLATGTHQNTFIHEDNLRRKQAAPSLAQVMTRPQQPVMNPAP